ncbi:MAG: nitrate reductase molybdenum cofactor assembly chaperone [Bacteroidota bacterium]
MMTLKILAALLDYPSDNTMADLAEMQVLLSVEGRLSKKCMEGLDAFISNLSNGDLLDVQAAWVEQFDRTRSLSLNLFEHVHGDSRDRGQAMVDLQAMYQRRGLTIGVEELPDYLPIFLEFLSTEPDAEARSLLGEASHVVAALAERLVSRGSAYAAVMAAVVELAGASQGGTRAPISTPETDDDVDASWGEDPVDFGAAAVPPPCGGVAVPAREGA